MHYRQFHNFSNFPADFSKIGLGKEDYYFWKQIGKALLCTYTVFGLAWLWNETSPLGWFTLKPRPKVRNLRKVKIFLSSERFFNMDFKYFIRKRKNWPICTSGGDFRTLETRKPRRSSSAAAAPWALLSARRVLRIPTRIRIISRSSSSRRNSIRRRRNSG